MSASRSLGRTETDDRVLGTPGWQFPAEEQAAEPLPRLWVRAEG